MEVPPPRRDLKTKTLIQNVNEDFESAKCIVFVAIIVLYMDNEILPLERQHCNTSNFSNLGCGLGFVNQGSELG